MQNCKLERINVVFYAFMIQKASVSLFFVSQELGDGGGGPLSGHEPLFE